MKNAKGHGSNGRGVTAVQARNERMHAMFEHARTLENTKRHIGGSLLPSSDARILQAVETPFGTLQVRGIAELDTHGLFLKHASGESLLVTHPNGYSCRVLLERMAKRETDRAVEQVKSCLSGCRTQMTKATRC